MVDLTYYHDWYRSAPHLHRSVGILLFLVMTFRLLWRLVSPPPQALPTHQP
jgi:cytochrome b561